MVILCTPADVNLLDEYFYIEYLDNSLTVSSKLELVENYLKFKESKNIKV
jgi:hypothetical protein